MPKFDPEPLELINLEDERDQDNPKRLKHNKKLQKLKKRKEAIREKISQLEKRKSEAAAEISRYEADIKTLESQLMESSFVEYPGRLK